MGVRRGVGVGLLLVGVVVGLLGGAAGGVAAQGVPIRIVQGSDGTLYVLKSGARFAIVSDSIEDDELEAYADGGTLGSADLLAAIGLSTGPAAASEARAPQASVPEPQA